MTPCLDATMRRRVEQCYRTNCCVFLDVDFVSRFSAVPISAATASHVRLRPIKMRAACVAETRSEDATKILVTKWASDFIKRSLAQLELDLTTPDALNFLIKDLLQIEHPK